jgi:hypothetical protein
MLKELSHLQSDVNSTMSLPFPVIYGFISQELSDTLLAFGLDAANVFTVGRQNSYATAINALIGMIHSLFYNETVDHSFETYLLRTNKIITYSNIIATYSNVLYTLFATFFGNKMAMRKIDLGGFSVTLQRMVSDEQLKNEIMGEYIKENFAKKIMGD